MAFKQVGGFSNPDALLYSTEVQVGGDTYGIYGEQLIIPDRLGQDAVRASQDSAASLRLSALTDHPLAVTTVNTLVDQVLRLQHIFLPATRDVNTVTWLQTTAGAYTADNYNGVGIYTSDGTDLTLIGSSTNDGNIWKATPGQASKALSATLTDLPAGNYWIGLLYNQSADTTAPELACVPPPYSTAVNSFGLGSSEAWTGYVSGNSSLPSTQAWSGVTKNGLFMRFLLGLGYQ